MTIGDFIWTNMSKPYRFSIADFLSSLNILCTCTLEQTETHLQTSHLLPMIYIF